MLKRKLAKSFVMKDFGVAKQILGMRITRDRKNWKLTFYLLLCHDNLGTKTQSHKRFQTIKHENSIMVLQLE